MDKDTMKQYRALLKEEPKVRRDIEKLKQRLDNVPVVAGKVKKSGDDFPYIEEHLTVKMAEPKEASEIKTRLRYKECRLDEIVRARTEIEEFVAGIHSSTDRQILELIYQDGMSQNEVADIVGLERSSVAKRISKYL